MKLFWISWYQLGDDYRPITFPPPKPVLGWWNTGSTINEWTLCAYVEAESAEDAEAVILREDAWPDAGRIRFCEPRDKVSLSDRFVLSEWMHSRLSKWAKEVKG